VFGALGAGSGPSTTWTLQQDVPTFQQGR